MKEKRIVVALGRNAFGETFPEQKKNVKKAAQAIADLVEQKYQIVITHSNGPQVGMIQTAMTEFARLDNDKNYTVAPMSLCGAMSEGYIGYDLQNAIRTELLDRGIFKPVSTIITQVRVDPFDKAFNHPTKVIGRVMTREEADAEEEKGNHVVFIHKRQGLLSDIDIQCNMEMLTSLQITVENCVQEVILANTHRNLELRRMSKSFYVVADFLIFMFIIQ